MQSFMRVPEYYPDIVQIIRSADWLVHNFRSSSADAYNAVDYQYNIQIDNITYTATIDMNILQYLLNIAKRPESSDLSRIAAAYLTFFQISDVQLDPTYAIYEKINHSDDRAEEAISNLELFRGIDNHSLDCLAAYALGYEQKLDIDPIESEDREKLRAELLRYKRLTNWDSLYLCILAITTISDDAAISRQEKIPAFVEWCISEFRLSLAALVYAAALFGRAPAKRMMKYKAQESTEKRVAALKNMAWDLYYVDRYMQSWVSRDERSETLMLTADNGLKLTIQLAIECQRAEGLEPLRPHLGNGLSEIECAYKNRASAKRAYNSEEWSYDYRKCLITKYESKLL